LGVLEPLGAIYHAAVPVNKWLLLNQQKDPVFTSIYTSFRTRRYTPHSLRSDMFEYGKNSLERWRSIYAFIDSWTGVRLGVKESDGSVAKIESDLDIELPESVRQWIAFSNSCDQITEYFSYRDCLKIGWLKEFDAISILLQGESDVYWGIKREHLHLDDPPVTVYFLDYESPDNKFFEQGEWAPSVSSFALDYLFSYFSPLGGDFALAGSITNELSEKLQEEIGLGYKFGSLRIYTNEDILVFTNQNEENWNNERIKCLFKSKVDPGKLFPQLKEFHKMATVLSGEFANSKSS
jgi:hypothetical protein